MSEYPILVFIALLTLGFGFFSRLSEKSLITPQMVFVLVGLIASNFSVSFLTEGINAPLVKIIAELTLVLVLFTDASTVNVQRLLREKSLPMRLLFIGLPITMVLGTLIAIPFFPGNSIWLIAMMALILSPTDAALGQAVVTSRVVPEKIRQTINVESGLNDGIALPPVLVCLAVLSAEPGHGAGIAYWGMFTLKQFIWGPIIGGLVGLIGGRMVEWASRRNWMNSTYQRLASIAIAILAYSLSEFAHGNGFIGAYFAGLLLGVSTTETREKIREFAEAETQAMQLFIFLLFGMILVPKAYPFWDARVWTYALLSLTVIRMGPVALSLLGTKLSWGVIGFIGWFGPRGIASVLYLMIAVSIIGMHGNEVVISTIVLTVLLSVLLHGLTAVPLSKFYKSTPQQQ